MKKAKGKKKVRLLSIVIGILIFLSAFCAGVVSKFTLRPEWAKQYSVEWSDEIGTLKENLSYGEGESEKFDLYLPKNSGKSDYGLVVYLHAGGFTSGDKSEDRDTLAWLCDKGYVAAGINYTLRTETNAASVFSQSEEIKSAIPKVVEAAAEAGYPVDKMAIAGGSAGHTLAMIYAYRDGKDAPVPVVFTFGAVGPSGFVAEDWGLFGIGQDSEESKAIGAALFSVMSGQEITPAEMENGAYLSKVHAISAVDYVAANPVPTVVAYGACDKVQPFLASKRLETALRESGADYRYFVMEHSGHALQNDNKVYAAYMQTVESYLEKYMG